MDPGCHIDCKACRVGFACCRSDNVSVDLTLGDVFRISGFLKVSPTDFIKEHVVLQPFFDPSIPINQLPMYRVSADLASPCRFLADGACGIQTVKPLTCLAFPGRIINQKDVSSCWSCFFPCTEEYSTLYFPYIDELMRLYEAEGMNLVERLLGCGLFRDCIQEANKLKKREAEIYGMDISLAEKDDLLMTELRESIKPRINKGRIRYKKVSGPQESFDIEVTLDVNAEINNSLADNLNSLREGVNESTKEYFRIREKYRI